MIYSLSCVQLFGNPWTVHGFHGIVHGILQARIWSGSPFPSAGDLPNPGIEPGFPTLQADSYWVEPPESFPGGASGKESSCKYRRHMGSGLILGSGRFPGGEHGNSLQYSCLENLMGRGAMWATVHRVSKSQTQLKWLSTIIVYNFIFTHFII